MLRRGRRLCLGNPLERGRGWRTATGRRIGVRKTLDFRGRFFGKSLVDLRLLLALVRQSLRWPCRQTLLQRCVIFRTRRRSVAVSAKAMVVSRVPRTDGHGLSAVWGAIICGNWDTRAAKGRPFAILAHVSSQRNSALSFLGLWEALATLRAPRTDGHRAWLPCSWAGGTTRYGRPFAIGTGRRSESLALASLFKHWGAAAISCLSVARLIVETVENRG
ncbi:uncharacterized protein J3D65DRAFT_639602 [Phyllosticta citribraziliensis]|uniref:Uncharacterized protein n=1 Tax=Phyllosticta citribraziliensis TaxID=989973 RepID=A0ABR1L6D4_9PEZI